MTTLVTARRRTVAQSGAAPAAGRSRWFAQVGWRHLVGVLAVLFSLFPIVFVVSAALNPLGTLSSTELVPDRRRVAGELRQPVRAGPRSPSGSSTRC